MLKFISVFILSCFVYIFSANAEDIEVVNNHRVENSAIISNLMFNGDGIPSEEEINNSLHKLYATGLFSRVNITTKGSKVIVDVQENPIVFSFKVVDKRGKNIFKDNNSSKNSSESNIITLKKGSIFKQSEFNNTLNNLKRKYKKEFKWNVSLVSNVYYLTDDLVKVEIIVDSSSFFDVSKVKKINFIGNKKIKDKRLKSSLAFLSESKWYDLLNIFGRYSDDMIISEIENLKKIYHSEGYINVSIDYLSEYVEQDNSFIISFIIDEDIGFKFGKIDIKSDDSSLLSNLDYDFSFLSGRTYNVNHVDKAISLIEGWLNKNDHLFRIELDKHINSETKSIDIVLKIVPDSKLTIDRVNIINSNEINEYIIRKNLGNYEGDVFNSSNASNSVMLSLRNSWISVDELRKFQSIKSSEKFSDKVDIVKKFTIPSVTSPKLKISSDFDPDSFLDSGVYFGGALKNIFGGVGDMEIGATLSRNGITGKFDFEDRFTLSDTILKVSFFDEGLNKKYFGGLGDDNLVNLPGFLQLSKDSFKTGFIVNLRNSVLDNLSVDVNYMYQFLSIKQDDAYLSNAYDSIISLGFNHHLMFDAFTGPYIFRTGNSTSLALTEEGLYSRNVLSFGIDKHYNGAKLSFNNKLSMIFGSTVPSRSMLSKSMKGLDKIYVDNANLTGNLLFDTEAEIVVPGFKSTPLSLDFALFVQGGGVYHNSYLDGKDHGNLNNIFRLTFGGELKLLIANMLPVSLYIAFPLLKADNDTIKYYSYGF